MDYLLTVGGPSLFWEEAMDYLLKSAIQSPPERRTMDYLLKSVFQCPPGGRVKLMKNPIPPKVGICFLIALVLSEASFWRTRAIKKPNLFHKLGFS